MGPGAERKHVRSMRVPADSRSGRVVFASHCLLNENVRYLGGACRRGAVDEALDRWQLEGTGICQMPCPEEQAWGGVLKPLMTVAYGTRRTWLWPARGILLGLFEAYTRARYALLACGVAAQVRDYRRSGYTMEGVVGVGGSPSCGVRTTLDVPRWLEAAGTMDSSRLTTAEVNQAVVAAARPGSGWFTAALAARLKRLELEDVPLLEHDLIAELKAGAASAPGRPGP